MAAEGVPLSTLRRLLAAALVWACTGVVVAATDAEVVAQSAGRLLSVVGDVHITGADGRTRTAQRGGDLREGDTLVTGTNALAQLHMADGAQMSARPQTEMKLERFSYAGEQDRQSIFLASIAKGGLRVITGLMARQNRAGYSIRTASAVVGVLGTHFELVHVPQAQPGVPAGTYNRVYDGVIRLQSRAGVLLLVNRDQTAFVSLRGDLAPEIILPPPALFSRPAPIPGIARRQQPTDTIKREARAGGRDATNMVPLRSIQAAPIQTTPLQSAPIQTTPILTAPTVASPKIEPSLQVDLHGSPAEQDAPRVLFCAGPCFAVDADGVRAPAPKGTTLRPNQRFETGEGAYAQLRLGPDAVIGVGDNARVRFEQLPGGPVVNLDLGRLRMIRESSGRPTRPIELNTPDGSFLLRDADVEIKKSPMTSVGANVTAVKVNAGEALLRSPQGDVPVGKENVQGVIGGNVLSQPIPPSEIVLVAPPTGVAAPAPIEEAVTFLRLPENAKVPETVLDPRYKASTIKPPLTRADKMPYGRPFPPKASSP